MNSRRTLWPKSTKVSVRAALLTTGRLQPNITLRVWLSELENRTSVRQIHAIDVEEVSTEASRDPENCVWRNLFVPVLDHG